NTKRRKERGKGGRESGVWLRETSGPATSSISVIEASRMVRRCRPRSGTTPPGSFTSSLCFNISAFVQCLLDLFERSPFSFRDEAVRKSKCCKSQQRIKQISPAWSDSL